MPVINLLERLSSIKVGEMIPLNITTPHPLYNENKPIWDKCRDAIGGDEDIKKAGAKYLPKLNGQTNKEYENYLNRAQWFGATSRTVDSYLGMIFRKNPQMFYDMESKSAKEIPDNFFNSITVDGSSLNEFINNVTEEIISVNRCGVLVEFPNDPRIVNAVSEYEKEEFLREHNLHPILAEYKTETIINWNWMYMDQKVIPTYFVLKEEIFNSYYPSSIVPIQTDVYRILMLEPYLDGFRYKQIKFQNVLKDSAPNNFKATEVIYPQKNGQYIPFIPFYVLDDKGVNYRTIRKPMVNDLVNTNIGHFRNSADWENELHIVGHKTLYFPGWDKKIHGNPKIGGALAGPANCEPTMIEASSDSGIKEEMNSKVEQMAVLGTERISSSNQYLSSAETAKVANASESSSLTLLATTLGKSFSLICDFVLSWAKYVDSGVNVQINKDFFQDDINGSELLEWMKAYQQGGVSWETYFYNLKKKEVYPDKWTPEKEEDAIQRALDKQFNLADEKYADVLEKIAAIRADVQATMTTTSSGQTMLSMSTQGGGANQSTSADLTNAQMEGATARNNETPGGSNATASGGQVAQEDQPNGQEE